MDKVSIVGVDLAKNVFQVHGSGGDDQTLFRKKLARTQFLHFMSKLEPCVVAMEACATANHWARALADQGHVIRLIPPVYVKPFVKRQKNDANDAEAIVEAASRPSMRTVPVKTSEQQARAMLFRTRELLVMQRTQLVNALRAHLAEHGVIVSGGRRTLEPFARALDNQANGLPDLVREIGSVYLDQLAPRCGVPFGFGAPHRRTGTGKRTGSAAAHHSGGGFRDCHGNRSIRPLHGGLQART